KGPGTSLRREVEVLTAAHARFAAHHVDHALEGAVVMRAGLGVGLNTDGAGPELLRTDARVVDGRLAIHARRLRRIAVERVAGDDAHAVVLPFRFVLVLVIVFLGHDDTSTARLLPPARRAGEALGLLGGAEQGLGLVDAFLLLGFGVGIGDDAGAGLHVHGAVLDQGGTQDDAAVELASGGEIADRASIESALLLLE